MTSEGSVIEDHIDFGYLPKEVTISNSLLSIVPKTDFQARLIQPEFLSNSIVEKDWIFLSRVKTVHSHRNFGLNKTHDFYFDSKTLDVGTANFLIWCLGFFYGIRLTSLDKGFVDATPIKIGKLVDFFLMQERQLGDILLFLAQKFCNYSDQKNLLVSAINALFWSQSPLNYQFESFNFKYMASDAIFRLLENQSVVRSTGHAKKIITMCEKFNIKCDKQLINDFVRIRRDLIHEAQAGGFPMGYAVLPESEGREMTSKLRQLVCRLIIGGMGLTLKDSEYFSGIDGRGTSGIEFIF